MFGKKEFIQSISDMNSKYKFDKQIGEGTFAKIYRIINKETNEEKACKKLSKLKISNITQFREEIRILHQIDHPNVINLHELFEDKKDIYLIMEECTGGSLFDRIFNNISNKNTISEKSIFRIFKQLMDALNHCHSQGICHRDLKPENIIFLNKEENSPIKIIDFGLGIIFQSNNLIFSKKVGSPQYVAPEVLDGEYDYKCDIWSAGVILYNLFSGTQPFEGKNEEEIFNLIKSKKICFPNKIWGKISEDAKDLISYMLCDVSSRYTAEQILNHKWMKYYSSESKKNEILLDLNIDGLKNYSNFKKFRKAVLTFIATRLKEDEIQTLKDIFVEMDVNNDGYLSLEEFKIACSKIQQLDVNIEELFNSIDNDKSGVINYTEFLAATIDKQIYHKEEKLLQAFRCFDQDKNGKISAKEVAKIIKVETDDFENFEEEIKNIDLNGDGEIDYSEFCAMMGKKMISRKSLKFENLINN